MSKISKGLTQAFQLQDFTFDAAMALKRSLARDDGEMKIAREDASAICSLVKAWESCQERVRIHRGKPLPGSLNPNTSAKRKLGHSPQSWASFSERPSQPACGVEAPAPSCDVEPVTG